MFTKNQWAMPVRWTHVFALVLLPLQVALMGQSSCTDPDNTDDDGDEWTENEGDCNDDPETGGGIYPGAEELCDGIDQNCNGDIDEGLETTAYYQDQDRDGYGLSSSEAFYCAEPQGSYTTVPGDCDDQNGDVNPGASEVCDSVDNDCDDAIDEAGGDTWYLDADGDGYGVSGSSTVSCAQPEGYVDASGDCNDADATIYPGTGELTGDSIDQNCDGRENCYNDSDNDGYLASSPTNMVSEDTDCNDANEGTSSDPRTDCNDSSATVNPAATETCNSVDDDCDAAVDEGVTTTYYRDSDGDGYGNSSDTKAACSKPAGYATAGGDCNDASSSVNPGATEVTGDSIDQNCDGKEQCFVDADNDGYLPNPPTTATSSDTDCADANEGTSTDARTDCNDNNAAAYPGATEVCDGADNDCDSSVDEGLALSTYYKDADGDTYGLSTDTTRSCAKPTGYASVSGDCNDSNAAINPAATEGTGDGVDQNCDGQEVCYSDADNDGYLSSSATTVTSTDTDCADANEGTSTDPMTDCNDSSASINPAAAETCNQTDDDCDGSTDEGLTTNTYYLDSDGDGYGDDSNTTSRCSVPSGYSILNGDCDDDDALTNPDAPEQLVGDGIDDDCSGTADDFAQVIAVYGTSSDTYSSIGQDLSIALQSNGLPHFALGALKSDGTGDVVELSYNAATDTETVAAALAGVNSSAYHQVSLFTTTTGVLQPRVVAYNKSTKLVRFSYYNGSAWSTPVSVFSSAGNVDGIDVATTSNGTDYVIFTWSTGSTGGGCSTSQYESKLYLYYRSPTSATFTIYGTGPISSGCSSYGPPLKAPSLVYGTDGYLHASWYREAAGTSYSKSLRYRRLKDGGSGDTAVDVANTSGQDNGRYSSIALSSPSSAVPAIAYTEGSTGVIKLATTTDRLTFTSTNLVSSTELGGIKPSMAAVVLRYDGAGKAHLLFQANSNTELWYGNNVSGTWVFARIVTSASSIAFQQYDMAIDADGNPRVAYRDNASEDLYYWKLKLKENTLVY